MRSIAAPAESVASCFLNHIPAFVEPELARLYETLHSSLPFFELFRSTAAAHCYVSWHDGRPVHIFLFILRGNCLEVLNEMIEVDEEELARFADQVFARFGQVDLIRFKALKTVLRQFVFPFQRYGAKYTYCIELPPTPEAFTASLGRGTMRGFKSKLNRLGRAIPTARMEFRHGGDIEEACLHRIMCLSEAGIAARGLKLRHEREKIIAMAKRCGYASALMAEGRILAGSISYRIGSSYFCELLGHDKQYDRLGLGGICTYLTIQEMIGRGARRFYLGGGHFEYKQRLGAELLGMDELKIYRSRWKMLANPQHAAGIVLDARIRAGKEFLHRHRDHALAKRVFESIYLLRNWSTK